MPDPETPDKQNGGLPLPALIGIIAGSAVLVIGGILLIVLLSKKKKA